MTARKKKDILSTAKEILRSPHEFINTKTCDEVEEAIGDLAYFVRASHEFEIDGAVGTAWDRACEAQQNGAQGDYLVGLFKAAAREAIHQAFVMAQNQITSPEVPTP